MDVTRMVLAYARVGMVALAQKVRMEDCDKTAMQDSRHLDASYHVD
jgi:hypothetical protein